MKKQILHLHQIITAIKNVAPVHQREYITLIWAIVAHTARQASLGRKELVEIMTDVRLFVDKLNKKYFSETLEEPNNNLAPRVAGNDFK